MTRTPIRWLVAVVIAGAVCAGAVAIVNATVFGPGAFVGIYLDAVARGDADGALSLPGVDAPASASASGGVVDDLLLTAPALSGLTGIRQVSDTEIGGGAHRVVMAWESPHGSGTTAFEVAPVGSRFGIFPEWGFRVSPMATVSLAVEHDPRFFANRLSTATDAAAPGSGSSAPRDYAVLVPGSYVFGHDTPYLTAETVTVLADEVGGVSDAAVDVQAGPAFIAQLDETVRASLDACTTQTVLFPTGCPFGQPISDRVASDPVWSIATYPAMAIEPGDDFATWQVEPTPAVAHLVVEVRSLFDGSIDTFDRDVPFEVSYVITIDVTAIDVRARF